MTDGLLERISGELGLELAKLQKDADGPAALQQANSMASEAEQRGCRGRPGSTFRSETAEPYEVRPGSFAIEEFRQILDDALAGAEPPRQ